MRVDTRERQGKWDTSMVLSDENRTRSVAEREVAPALGAAEKLREVFAVELPL